MAWGEASKRKYGGEGKKGGTKKRKTNGGKGGKMQYVTRTAGGQVVSEMKYFDAAKAATALVASTDWTGTEFDPTANALFTPAQGNLINQRDSRKVHVRSLKMKGVINVPAQINQTAIDASCDVRLILYQDMQTNGAQSQGEDVMSNASSTAVGTFCGFMDLDNLGRFKILKEKIIHLPVPPVSWDGTNVEQGGVSVPFKFNCKWRSPGLLVHFNAGNNATVADIVDHSFHIIAQATDIGLAPTIAYQVRTGYKDY